MTSLVGASSEASARSTWLGRLPPIAMAGVLGIAASIVLLTVERQCILPGSVPLFVAGVVLFLYVPGRLLLSLFGGARDESAWPLALGAGAPVALALFHVAGPLLPRHAVLGMALVAAIFLFRRDLSWRPASVRLPSTFRMAGVTVVAALGLWGLSQITFRGAQREPDDGVSYMRSNTHAGIKVGASDVFFHAGLTGALARDPALPTNPYMVGEPMSYHYGMDLLGALFARELGIHALDLSSRLLPTLFLLTLLGLVFMLARALRLSPPMSLLASLFVLGADFGILMYLFPVRAEWPLQYWLGMFAYYPEATLFWGNTQLPALVVMTAALLVIATKGDARRGRILGGLLLGSVVFFKVFLALQVAAALVAVAAWSYLRARRLDWLDITGVAGTVMLGVALANQFFGESQATVAFSYLPPVLARLRLAGLQPLVDILLSARSEPTLARLLQAVSVVAFYFVMLLGVRVAVVPGALRTAWRPTGDRVRDFLAYFFLLGLVPPHVMVFVASGIDNSFWFVNQSLFAGALLLADRIDRIELRRYRLAASALALVLGLSPTIRSIDFWGGLETGHVSSAELSASLHLGETAASSDVVLHQLFSKTPSPASHFAGLPTVLTHWQGFPLSFAERGEVDARLERVGEFFRTRDANVARGVLDAYGVRWVYSLKSESPIRFDPDRLLEKIYENSEVVIYRVTREEEESTANRNVH